LSLGRAASGEHHLRVLVAGHAGHRRGGLLETLAVGGEDLGEEINVAAFGDGGVVVAREHGLLLGLGHRPLVEVGPLVATEPLAVLWLHQTHAELVELEALPRTLRGEHRRARDVVEFSWSFMRRPSNTVASDYRPGVYAAVLASERSRDEVDDRAVIGHVVVQIRVRPVGSPEHASRETLDDPSRERYDVAVVRGPTRLSRSGQVTLHQKFS